MIGVLALQGAFAKQAAMIEACGEKAVEVRQPDELGQCRALIIPGGESTAMLHQMHGLGFTDAIRSFSQKKSLFGICAGLILLSRAVRDHFMKPLGLFDLVIERNAYGRQNDSFQTEIEGYLDGEKRHFSAAFIRAPRIQETGSSVQVLARYEGAPVLIQQGRHLGASFHPELVEDRALYIHFLRLASLA